MPDHIDADQFMEQLNQNPELLAQVKARLLTEEILQLTEKTDQLKHSISQGQQNLSNRLSNLEKPLEDPAAAGNHPSRPAQPRVSEIPSTFQYPKEIMCCTVIHRRDQETAPFLNDMIKQALQTGSITKLEAEQIRETEAIAVGSPKGRDDFYLVADAAMELGPTDIKRVKEHAEIMMKITPKGVVTLITGNKISNDDRMLAEHNNVLVSVRIRTEEPGQGRRKRQGKTANKPTG